MYKKIKAKRTSLKISNSYIGETIEQKVFRITNNKEKIESSQPLIYTERVDGVQAAYDIRTDRWDIAVDAMNIVDKTHKAKREERHTPKIEENKIAEGETKPAT